MLNRGKSEADTISQRVSRLSRLASICSHSIIGMIALMVRIGTLLRFLPPVDGFQRRMWKHLVGKLLRNYAQLKADRAPSASKILRRIIFTWKNNFWETLSCEGSEKLDPAGKVFFHEERLTCINMKPFGLTGIIISRETFYKVFNPRQAQLGLPC